MQTTIANTTNVNFTELTRGVQTYAGDRHLCRVPKGNYKLPMAPVPSGSHVPIITRFICASVKQKSSIANTLFKSLNPGISSQCTNTVLCLAYCIFSIYAPCASTPTGPPANFAPGTMLKGCTQYYTVASGDGRVSIESKYSLTLAQFIAVNPEINSAYTNLALAEAYCVATSNSTSTSTGSPPH